MSHSLQKLRDLLFPPKITGNNTTFSMVTGDQLISAAYFEIEGLRSKLCHQSAMLAEALKLKNDALKELEAARIVTQSVHDSVPARFTTLAVADAVRALSQALREAEQLCIGYDKRAMHLATALEEAQAELKRLKPPEPKFRVGQVVHSAIGKSAGKIGEVKHHSYMGSLEINFGDGWYYRLDNYSAWWHESKLRALTDDEK